MNFVKPATEEREKHMMNAAEAAMRSLIENNAQPAAIFVAMMATDGHLIFVDGGTSDGRDELVRSLPLAIMKWASDMKELNAKMDLH